MKVRFLMDCEGPEFGAVKKGAEMDLAPEIERRLIKRGVCENVSAPGYEPKSKKKKSEVISDGG